MRRYRKRLSGDVDGVARRQQRLVGQDAVAARVTHRDRPAVLAAVTRGGELTDVLAVHQDRLTAPWKGSGFVKRKEQQSLHQSSGSLTQKRIAAYERCRLVEPDRIAEPRFPRCLIGRKLGAPGAAARFDAQGVDGVIAGILQARGFAGAP